MNRPAQLVRRPARARVEIIPLIDVIFFLLATFVLFTLSLDKLRSLRLELPETDSREDVGKILPLIIRVSAAGGIYWENDAIHEGELPARLARFRVQQKDPRIMISGDPTARFDAAITVLDAVYQSGITAVTFDMKPGSGRR